jgi:hypothetical protein
MADNHQGPGLLLMPVMGTCRGERVHLSEWIDLMPIYKQMGLWHSRWTRVIWGQMLQEGRMMMSGTWLLWGLVLQELQKVRVMVLVATCPVECEGGVKGDGALKKRTMMDNLILFPSRGVVTKVN